MSDSTAQILAAIDGLRTEMAEIRTDLRAEMADLRVALMSRMDRLQDAFRESKDFLDVNLTASQNAEEIAKSTRRYAEATSDQVMHLRNIIRSLESRVQNLEEKP